MTADMVVISTTRVEDRDWFEFAAARAAFADVNAAVGGVRIVGFEGRVFDDSTRVVFYR